MEKESFDFMCPTRMIYRPEGLSLIGKIIREDYHFHRILFLYGTGSLKKSGRYDVIVRSLNESQIEFMEFGGILSNPDIEEALKIIEASKKYRPELILAVGGGSVLDMAKAVSHGYYYNGNPLDFCKKTAYPLHALPVGTVLTLSASGSEMSDSCVLSDRRHHYKGGFNSKTNYPLFSLLDPTLTYSVSPYQTGIGLADMFSHSMERYFSPSHVYEPCDDLALGIMKSIVEVSLPVLSHPDGYEERRAMMICGSLAHDGFTNYGKKMFFRVHAGAHKLCGAYPQMAHGQAIALLMPTYLKKNILGFNDKIIQMGRRVFGRNEDVTASSSIQALQDWLSLLPIAHSYEELGYEVKEEVIQKAESFLEVK